MFERGVLRGPNAKALKKMELLPVLA